MQPEVWLRLFAMVLRSCVRLLARESQPWDLVNALVAEVDRKLSR